MRLLLDTHIILWCLDHDPRLSPQAWTSLETAEAVWVSSASLWEASIKYQLGRLSVKPERLVEGVSASRVPGAADQVSACSRGGSPTRNAAPSSL